MFELYNLPGSALLPQHFAVKNDGREHYRVHGIAFPPQPMLLLRQIMAQAFARRDESARQTILSRHKTLLALVFGQLNSCETLIPRDLIQTRPLAARLESNLTHNMASSSNLISESVALLESLLAGESVRIVISDYSRLDDMSMRLLIELIKRRETLDIHWAVGLPEHYHTMPRIEVHGQGIEWLPTMHSHRNDLYALKDLTPFREHHIDARAAGATGATGEHSNDDWDNLTPAKNNSAEHDLAWDERAIFIVYPQTMPAEDEWYVLYSAACHAFQLFAFASALFYAQHAIAMGRGVLSAQRRATLHGICAVAAHNRQFFAERDDAIARYILNQLNQAIALEEQPTVRCAHWYRLAVTEGRRLGHTARALAHVSNGFAEIGRGHMSRQEALLAETWLYNIKGYCQLRAHQAEAAEEAMMLSYRILDGVDFTGTGLEDEARLTLAVTVENTMTLMRRMARTEQWQQLQQTAEHLSSPWPIFNSANLAEKADLAIFKLDLRAAVEYARAGVHDSTLQYNPAQRLYFTTMLADLYLRAGCWQTAATTFLQALELPANLERRRHTAPLPAADSPLNLPVYMACARALLHAGQTARAAQLLDQCLAHADALIPPATTREAAAQGETAAQPGPLKESDLIHLRSLRLEAAHRENQEDVLQQLCDDMTAIVKRAPELVHLTAVNAAIATIAWRRGDYSLAEPTANNSWKQGRILLTALCENKIQPDTYLIDALLKSFLHPLLLPKHASSEWRQIVELIANTLRSHTISWLYLDALLNALREHGHEALLRDEASGQCLQRAIRARQECQGQFGHDGLPGDNSRPQAAEPLRA